MEPWFQISDKPSRLLIPPWLASNSTPDNKIKTGGALLANHLFI
jgi:hypothetical protein